MTEDRIAQWSAAGELQKAAEALRGLGELLRAQELYERAWDFASAAAIAAERGDRVAELRIALARQDLAAAMALFQALRSANRHEQERAAALYEQHHLYMEAAELREALEEWDAARELYQKEGERGGVRGLLGASRLDERQGRLLAAADGYAAALRTGQGTPRERCSAALGSGRVLLRCGRLDDAVQALQEARRQARQALAALPDGAAADAAAWQPQLDEIEGHLVEAFVALGEPEVARVVLASLAARQGPKARAASLEPAEFVQRAATGRSGTQEPELLLGRYRLVRMLGAGSMGRVYLAEDGWQHRQVALKLLPLAASASRAHQGLYRRFCREAQVLCSLHHPNLLEVHDFHAGAGIMALEYLPGGALSGAKLPLPLPVVRRVLLGVLEALMVVHAAGVLHRDIKPHNLFLSPAGAVKLGDFGAASLRELGLTQTEGLVGTLAYMAPEQIRGDELSFATDVYGLGVTGFELCTGSLPFSGPDFIEQHLSTPPPDAASLRSGLPKPWSRLLRQLLAKAPAERGASLEALRQLVHDLPVPALLDDAVSAADEPEAPPKAPAVRLPAAEPALLTASAHSALFLTTDARLGRPLLVERFQPGVLQGELGASHLAWLRGMARLAGPGLQRVLRIDLHSQPGAQVYFDVPSGLPVSPQVPLARDERSRVARLLLRLHDAGLVHGSVAGSLVREPAQPLLLLGGRGPLSWSAPRRPEADLADLELLGG